MAASFERYAYMSPKLHPVESPEKGGHGLIAREPIRAGERLLVWGGAIVDHDRLKKLPAILQRRSVQVDDGLYLVTPVEDEPADYINHSCAPNAGLQGQLTVVAMRAIDPGEEVCFDYAMTDASPYDQFDCECGAPTCRGRVTGNDWLLPELQERYRGYFSTYVQGLIDRSVERVTHPQIAWAL